MDSLPQKADNVQTYIQVMTGKYISPSVLVHSSDCGFCTMFLRNWRNDTRLKFSSQCFKICTHCKGANAFVLATYVNSFTEAITGTIYMNRTGRLSYSIILKNELKFYKYCETRSPFREFPVCWWRICSNFITFGASRFRICFWLFTLLFLKPVDL
jgi:hypothetical protein